MVELPELMQHIIVISITVGLMVLLLFERIKPAYIFFGAVMIFLLTGIIETGDFLDALSNESILSIFLLIFITYGVRTNFNILGAMDKLFGKAEKGRSFVFRMSSTVALSSSFLNNTPIVALFLPYVYQWSKKRKISPSKLLIPLSFASIVGGMITVIGTSTNLVLKGLVEDKGGTPPGAIDYLLPGLLVTAGAVVYLSTVGYSLLPDRKELLDSVGKKTREYMVNITLAEDSEIAGKTVKEADLQDHEGIELFEIIRYGSRISPVWGHEKIRQNDTLVFVGDPDKIVELFEKRDEFLLPRTEREKKEEEKEKAKKKQEEEDKKNGVTTNKKKEENDQEQESEEEKDDEERSERNIVETVVPANSALTGRTLRGYGFKYRYDAVVIGIHRNGEALSDRIDRIRIQPGDMLLMIPGKNFQAQTSHVDDFYVVSVVKTLNEVSSKVIYGFFGILSVAILGMIFGKISLFIALLLITSYMIGGRMVDMEDLKNEFSINLFIVLFGSLAFSTALINSGVAEMAANGFMGIFESMGNRGIVIGIFLVTLLLTSFVTHVAAVAIIFPIAFSIGSQISDLNMTAVYVAIAFAASASFHTPFSYQTNMMVYGPGGYKFTDFLKAGSPLTLLYAVLVIGFIIMYYGI